MWGLAHLARTDKGRKAIDDAVGRPVCDPTALFDKSTVKRAITDQPAALDTLAKLMLLGFQTARRTGGSMGIFVGSDLNLPPKPPADDVDAIEAYSAEIQAALCRFTDWEDDELGPVRLSQACGTRGSAYQLCVLVGANVGRTKSVWSQREGQPASLLFQFARSAWSGLQQVHTQTALWNPVWKHLQI